MKKVFPALLLLIFAATAQAQVNAWENPSVTEVNREPPRTQLMSYSTADEALGGSRSNSAWVQTLDTEWTQQGAPNATVYKTRYKVPFAWIDRELFLRIPSAPASYEVRVNGEPAGYSQQAKTAAEFDITKRSKEGYNDLEIVVYNDPVSRALENYTHPIIGRQPVGVCIVAQPRIRIRDIVTDAVPEGGGGLLNAGVVVKSHLLNPKRVRLYYELRTPDGKTLSTGYRDAQFEMRGEDTLRFFVRAGSVRPWSSEQPVLYKLLLKMQQEGRFTEYVCADIGFRSVGVEGASLTVNGQKLHTVMADFTPSGNLQQDEARIAELKGTGVNTLRLLPFPASEEFYAMCDRAGIYLCPVADVNTHLAGDSRTREGNPSNDPKWRDAFVDRALSMYHTAKIHPSVVLLSTADNSSNGYNLYESYLALKALEPSRPVIYAGAAGEWNSDAASMEGNTLVMRSADYTAVGAPLFTDSRTATAPQPTTAEPSSAATATGSAGTSRQEVKESAPVPAPTAQAPTAQAPTASVPATPSVKPESKSDYRPEPGPEAASVAEARPQSVSKSEDAGKQSVPQQTVTRAETENPVIPVRLNVDDGRRGYFSLTNLYASTPLTKVEVIYSVVTGRREVSKGSLLVDIDPKETTKFQVPMGDYIIGGKFDIFLDIAVPKAQLVNFTPQQHLDQTQKEKRRKPVDSIPRTIVDAFEFSISL